MSEQPIQSQNDRLMNETQFDDAVETQIDLHRYITVPKYDIRAVEHGRAVFDSSEIKEIAAPGAVEIAAKQLSMLAWARDTVKRNEDKDFLKVDIAA